MPTYNADTGLHKSNTVYYLGDKEAVVQFVLDRLERLKEDRVLTTTIRLANSEGFYAATVITGLSDDTPIQAFSNVLPDTFC